MITNAKVLERFLWIARGLSLSRRIRHLEERWMYYLAFGTVKHILSPWSDISLNILCRLTVGSSLYVGQHPRKCSALCANLPIREYPISTLLHCVCRASLVHHHGDARAPRTTRSVQSVLSYLGVLRLTDYPSIPIRAYSSPRLRPRDLSQ